MTLEESACELIGVPFKHRGRNERGVDCAGMVWLSYSKLGQTMPDLSRYGREPHKNGMMLKTMEALGNPIWQGEVGQVVPRELLKPSDVVVMRFVKQPHHMGVIGTDSLYGLSLIHADGNLREPRVVKHGLDANWQSRIVAVFRKGA